MTEKPPFRLIQRKRGVGNSLFDVFLDDVEAEDGTTVRDFFVASPKQKIENEVTGVAILPVQDGKFGLIHLYRHPLQIFCWEIPRGFINPTESVPASALRELEEETSFTCDPKDLIPLGQITPDSGCYAARVRLFAARNLKPSTQPVEKDFGHKKFQFLTEKEVKELIQKGLIEDSATLVAYYRFKEN